MRVAARSTKPVLLVGRIGEASASSFIRARPRSRLSFLPAPPPPPLPTLEAETVLTPMSGSDCEPFKLVSESRLWLKVRLPA